ncbi:OmpA family protein [Trichloromonas sp.]|uniref:OmpA family protein n=1 Tax=Trichloromonas sp. TaxID=3069249 RepID=UPI003D813C34
MNRKSQFVCSLALAVMACALLASCGPPMKNADLEKAQAAFAEAKMDPVVVKKAPLGLQTAEASLLKAEKLLKAEAEPKDISHHAYLALQRTAIAKETAKQKVAEESIEAASSDRAKVLLEARTDEAEKARKKAEEQTTLLQAKTAEAQQATDAAKAAEARAKQLEAEVAQLHATKSERGLVITLGDVLFDTGKAELKGGAVVTISKIANFMRTYPTRKLLVEGFTDSRGSESYNLDLSERRANAVRTALTANGVETERISVRGYGETFPVASNESPEGRQLNRRVEVIISDEDGRIIERR